MEGIATLIIWLLVSLICGGICAAIANAKGRNQLGWFFIGTGGAFVGMLGCLFWVPILIVAVLPNLNEQRERESYHERENRRLREQIRQERMKADAFRQHTQARLDVHDQTLGMDTRDAAALPGATTRSTEHLLEAQTGPDNGHWYYELNGESVGPTSLDMIGKLLRGGHLTPTTLIWTEQLGDWTAAHDVPALAEHLDGPNGPA